MLRPILASLVALAALTAFAPQGAAVAICSNQLDPTDLVVGDDPLARSHCTTENLISYDCDLVDLLRRVAVDAQVAYDGTVTRSTRCDPLIYCVTEPCPGPYLSASSAAALPCGTVGSPVLDAGFGVTCTAAGTRCTVVVATFGTIEDFLTPHAGCQFPIYCFRECGPPMAAAQSQESPCLVASDPSGDLSATCSAAFCEVGPVVEDGKYDHAVSCESFIYCVTEPCPGSGRIEI